MNNRPLATLTLLGVLLLASCAEKTFQIQVIPYPNEVHFTKGKIKASNAPVLEIVLDSTLHYGLEEYTLEVMPKRVILKATTSAGVFYGKQTWNQLMEQPVIPCMTIQDAPRFAYRGMHLDVSRHFFSTDFIKKQLDAMASYKLNTFHWHLTDGAGWRIQIPDYPLLTSVAAWRPFPTWKEWWAGDRHYAEEGAPGAYGGYYTADQVRDIVAYAAERHITVIPEIEMPGHSDEVLAVYPQLSCAGEPYKAGEFCIGNTQVYTFLENVLDVVMDLFPSEYIHIGGDEANKAHWQTCPKCQALMRKEGMTDVAQLQSYLIHRMEAYLNAHGRQIIGWDEILEGGLSPHATVMSWRGESGGIAAARAGHDAVMTPGGYCYLDGYQADPSTQPEAIGGYLTLDKVYSYDPAPETMEEEVRAHILGVQANLWTEYIPTPEHAEYMLYPRLTALAEVAWTQPENKDWMRFKLRANEAIASLQARGYHPFPLFDRPLSSQVVHADEGFLTVDLYSERTGVQIRYTTDGKPVTNRSKLFRSPFRVSDSLQIRAALLKEGILQGPELTLRADYHKGIGKKAVYKTRIYPDYAAGGDSALTDGYRGGKGYGDGRWQGFCPNPLDVTIDLGKPMQVKSVQANFMQVVGPWIFFPSKVEVFASLDGEEYQLLGTQECEIPVDREGALFMDFGWKGAPVTARYIQYVAHQSSKKAFIFTDEIVIQ